MKKINFILLLLTIVSFTELKAQKNDKKEVVAPAAAPVAIKTGNIQPSIMVVPFAKEGQDMRAILENDLNLRVALTKVKEGFDKRGFSTKDFRAALKQLSNDKAMETGNQTSLKQEIIELSGADIYVETEAKKVETSGGNSITVIVTAYDAFSGTSLANKVGNSPKFYTDNYEKLTEKAVDDLIEDFLNTIQSKFTEMSSKGRIATLNVSFAEGSTMDMDSEVGADKQLLSEAIEGWLQKNAFNAYFHVQGVTSTKMIVDEVRLPFKDDKGEAYRATKFAVSLKNYLKSLGLEATRDVQGSKIFIKIN